MIADFRKIASGIFLPGGLERRDAIGILHEISISAQANSCRKYPRRRHVRDKLELICPTKPGTAARAMTTLWQIAA
jgi:hypothetical protein